MATVIRKIDTSQIPRLGDANYTTWKFQVSLVLKAHNLFQVVNGTEKKPATSPETWIEKDNQAMAIIASLVDTKQINHIAGLDSS